MWKKSTEKSQPPEETPDAPSLPSAGPSDKRETLENTQPPEETPYAMSQPSAGSSDKSQSSKNTQTPEETPVAMSRPSAGPSDKRETLENTQPPEETPYAMSRPSAGSSDKRQSSKKTQTPEETPVAMSRPSAGPSDKRQTLENTQPPSGKTLLTKGTQTPVSEWTPDAESPLSSENAPPSEESPELEETPPPEESHSYINWTDFANILVDSEWVDRRDINAWLMECKAASFSNRFFDKVRINYTRMPRIKRLFDMDRRFPDGLYVNLSNSTLGDLCHIIICSYDLPSKNKESRDCMDISEFKYTYESKVREACKLINSTDLETLTNAGVFDTATFETKFNLTWQ